MNINQKAILREAKDYFVILIGLISYTIGWTLFLLPNNIALGGVPGISSILKWAWGTPVQATFFSVNAVLLILALKILGLKLRINQTLMMVLLL